MKAKRKKVYRLTETELRGMMSEAVHTAFRKGSDHPAAHKVWTAIRDMPNDEWGNTVDWMVWSLFYAKKQADQSSGRK